MHNQHNHKHLTQKFVQSVNPGPQRVLYWDAVQKGLALQVQPTGHKSYKLVYKYNRRSRWYTIGDARAITIGTARDIAQKKWAEICNGVDVQAEKAAGRQTTTFSELAILYVEEHAKRRNRSWRQADKLVRSYLLPSWANIAVKDIKRADVRRLFNGLTNDGHLVLANQVLAAASAVFSWAIREEVADLSSNPCRGIRRNATKARERILSDAELPKLWAACDDAPLVQGRALKMLLFTGQRPGEVAHMRREHIELHDLGAWWNMPGAPDPETGWPGTKNGASHRVWLTGPALAIVEELCDEDEGFVFASNKGKAITGLDGAMRAISKDCGFFPPVRPHDLRRTHGTTVTRLGFGRDAMNRIQNHKEGGIASVYDRHNYADEMKRVQQAVTEQILGSRHSNVIPLKA
jgi:integrase